MALSVSLTFLQRTAVAAFYFFYFIAQHLLIAQRENNGSGNSGHRRKLVAFSSSRKGQSIFGFQPLRLLFVWICVSKDELLGLRRNSWLDHIKFHWRRILLRFLPFYLHHISGTFSWFRHRFAKMRVVGW